MTEWIDVTVYAAMAGALWSVVAVSTRAYLLMAAADRNAEWLAANGDKAAGLLGGRWLLGSVWFGRWCGAWGLMTVAILVAIQAGVWPRALSAAGLGNPQWEILKDTNSLLLIAGLVFYVACVGVAARRLHGDVPLAERRRATLAPRTVGDYVPRWLWIATHLLVAAHLAAWAAVGVLGLARSPGFWVRIAGPVAFTAIYMIIVRVMVHRRPSRDEKPGARRSGVGFALAGLAYVQVRFAVQLYGEVAPGAIDADRVMHLGLVLCLAVGLVLVLASTSAQQGGSRQRVFTQVDTSVS